MYNKVLKAITNRERGFVSPIFAGNDDFIPELDPPTEVTALRKTLGLDIEDTDYYLVAALGCIEGNPLIHKQFNEEVQTYDLVDYQCPIDSVSDDFTLTPTQDGEIDFNPSVLEFPIPHKITFKATKDKTVHLTMGGYSWSVPFRSRISNVTTIFFEWPEELGIKGSLTRDYKGSDPYTGFEGEFLYCPRTYPYDMILNKINTDHIEFITKQNLIREYSHYTSKADKIAIACLALAKSNTAVYG